MHKLIVGIEHLMTGLQIKSDSPLTWERESPSTFRVLSSSKIEAYWPAKQSFVESMEEQVEEQEFSPGEAEYYAQVFGQALRRQDSEALETLEKKGVPRPNYDVVRSMRRKFGAQADLWIAELKWDGIMKCYYFVRNGIYHGVERDGYIHT